MERSTDDVVDVPLLQCRPAVALLASRVVSDIGDFLGLAAVLLYAYEVSGGLLGPGAAFAALAAPAVLIGLVGGRWLSGTHPGHGLVATHLFAAVTVAAMATAPSLPLVLGGMAVLGACRTITTSLRMTALSSSVPAGLRQRVLAWSSTSYQAGQVIGYVTGALAMVAVGPQIALLVDAGTFVVAAAVLSAVHFEPAVDPGDGERRGATFSALREVLGDRRVALLLVLTWLSMLTSTLPEAAAPAMASGARAGWLMAAAPAGATLGSLVLTRCRTLPDRLLALSGAGYGLSMVGLGIAIGWGGAFGPLLAATVASGVLSVWVIGVQARVAALDPGLVARVYAALSASMLALEGVGALLLGVLEPVTGAWAPFAAIGLAMVGVAVIGIATVMPRERAAAAPVVPVPLEPVGAE